MHTMVAIFDELRHMDESRVKVRGAAASMLRAVCAGCFPAPCATRSHRCNATGLCKHATQALSATVQTHPPAHDTTRRLTLRWRAWATTPRSRTCSSTTARPAWAACAPPQRRRAARLRRWRAPLLTSRRP
jgi:hypothetical protein